MTETLRDDSGPNSDRDDTTDAQAARPSTPISRPEADRSLESAPNEAPVGGPPSQGKVRRSSLRPAPADYRPNVRDPSTMRPMMVVRAGDVDPSPAQVGPVTGEQGELTLPLPQSKSRQEAIVPADGGAPQATLEPSPPVIPPAPAVPIDLVPISTRHGRQEGSPVSSEVPPSSDSAPGDVPTTSDAPAAHETAREPAPSQTAETTRAAESRKSSRSPLAIALVAVTLAAIALVMKHGASDRQSRATRAASGIQSPATIAPAAPSHGDRVQEPAELAATEQAGAAAAAASLAEQAASAPASASAPQAPAASAPPPGTTRVRLDLKPTDAKVYIRGREIPGPPYEFDIAKDQRVAVEVVRFGFATAKVVLDDKKPVVSFGMLRERWNKGR